jgi:hypothetical protein
MSEKAIMRVRQHIKEVLDPTLPEHQTFNFKFVVRNLI